MYFISVTITLSSSDEEDEDKTGNKNATNRQSSQSEDELSSLVKVLPTKRQASPTLPLSRVGRMEDQVWIWFQNSLFSHLDYIGY